MIMPVRRCVGLLLRILKATKRPVGGLIYKV
jgi:hypothetical protein